MQKQLVNEIEKILLKAGFEKVKIKLAQIIETNDGISEIDCYKKEQIYCRINIFSFVGKTKRFVVIEYAYSLSESEHLLFEDGVPIYINTPTGKILNIIIQELKRKGLIKESDRNKNKGRLFGITWIAIIIIIAMFNSEIAAYFFVFSLFSMLIFAFLLNNIFSKWFKEIEITSENLNNNCDVVAFIKAVKRVRRLFGWIPIFGYSYGVLLVYGYINAGEFDKARKLLKTLKNNRWAKKDIQNKIALSNFAIQLFITAEDFVEAKKEIQNLEEILNTNELSEKDKENYLDGIKYYKREITGFEGDYKDLELLLLDSIKNAKITLTEVILKYCLAKIYLKLNKEKKANELIDYILKNGGNTYYVKEIKKMVQ